MGLPRSLWSAAAVLVPIALLLVLAGVLLFGVGTAEDLPVLRELGGTAGSLAVGLLLGALLAGKLGAGLGREGDSSGEELPVLRETPAFGAALDEADNVVLVAFGRDGVVTRVNRGAEKVLGTAAADAPGRPLHEALFSADDAVDLPLQVARLFATARPTPPQRLFLKDGDGGRIEAVAALCPVARKGRVEEAVLVAIDPRAAEGPDDRRVRLLDAAPAALAEVDADGRLRTVSRGFAALLGRRAENLVGIDVARAEILSEPLRETLHALATARPAPRAAGEPVEREGTVALPGGVEKPVLAFVAAQAGGGADVVLVDGASRRRLLAERDAARAALALAREAAEPAAAETTPRPGGVRILLVEDNDENRELIAHMLRSRGAEVTAVATGREAVDAVSRVRFDGALLDIQMPGMDGYEVARRLRALPNGSLPLFALTAHTSDEERRRAAAEGMDGFLSKPVSLAKIGELVATWRRAP